MVLSVLLLLNLSNYSPWSQEILTCIWKGSDSCYQGREPALTFFSPVGKEAVHLQLWPSGLLLASVLGEEAIRFIFTLEQLEQIAHNTEILFQRKVSDLVPFSYFNLCWQDKTHPEIHSQGQGLSHGCSPQKWRKSSCFEQMANKALRICSFSLLSTPRYYITVVPVETPYLIGPTGWWPKGVHACTLI